MEWWHYILGIAGALLSVALMAAIGIAAWSLKVLFAIRDGLTGMQEWRKHVDRQLEGHGQEISRQEGRLNRHSQQLGTRSAQLRTMKGSPS